MKPPIQEIFKRGDEVVVQVIKEGIGTKGPSNIRTISPKVISAGSRAIWYPPPTPRLLERIPDFLSSRRICSPSCCGLVVTPTVW